jgi:hypothetical protein
MYASLSGSPFTPTESLSVREVTTGGTAAYGVAFNHCEPLSGNDTKFWGNVDVASTKVYKVAGTQVVGARVVDARCDDAVNSGDATTDGVIDALRDAMIAHGLIAAA